MGTHTKHASVTHDRRTPRFDSDWHPADVKASLEKRGHTMTALAAKFGYSESAVRKALKQRWPAVQSIIADALELDPQMIWPSRYDANGDPIRDKPWSRRNRSTPKRRRNVYRGRAA